MAAFELSNNETQDSTSCGGCGSSGSSDNPARSNEDSIIALKIYDSCRQQDCLTADLIGPARCAEDITIGDREFLEGDVLTPPNRAATVNVEDLKVKTVTIVNKKLSPFRKGFWDVDLKYVFEYYLTFHESDGTAMLPARIKSNSFFNRKITLFGSESSDITISTDLFAELSQSMQSGPYVEVEAKAIALSAEVNFCGCMNCQEDRSDVGRVDVTIGLFSIIKLFRIVDLSIESSGFHIPEECEYSPVNPCDYFDLLDFPLDIFAPPLRADTQSSPGPRLERQTAS